VTRALLGGIASLPGARPGDYRDLRGALGIPMAIDVRTAVIHRSRTGIIDRTEKTSYRTQR
jgi:hypothetical protein